jgi:hypothetical protein
LWERIPLAIYCPASLAPYRDADRLFTETKDPLLTEAKQGFDFYQHNISESEVGRASCRS